VAVLPHEMSALGPYQALVGSPLWAEARRAVADWTLRGQLPARVVA
jgi:hypothetical protein